jgi:hypothetical protein
MRSSYARLPLQWPYTLGMSTYLLYMFRHFKTSVSVHHPLEHAMQRRLGDFFRHPIDSSAAYEQQICPFGQQAVLLLVAFMCVRAYLHATKRLALPALRKMSAAVMLCAALASLMNMNAVLYLLPYFAAETVLLV